VGGIKHNKYQTGQIMMVTDVGGGYIQFFGIVGNRPV